MQEPTERRHMPHATENVGIPFAAIVLAMLPAVLDQTILATALPTIAGDLGSLADVSWVVTAYVVAAAATMPVWGKLGDRHGRKLLLEISLGAFVLASALCALAQDIPELIGVRMIQGAAAGGLMTLAMAAVGDLVAPRERGRYQGYIAAVFATATVVGPLIGGLLVENVSWRWVFLVNLPVGGVALAVISVTMPRRARRMQHTIDWLGAVVLAGGTGSLLLGLVWGGRQYSWTSVHVTAALALAAGSLAAFAVVERRAREPILPFDILRNPIVAGSVACMALVGMAMFGTISYVPLFVQGVIGTSATSSGVVLTPFMLGAVTTSIVSGQLVSRIGRYRPNTIIGPIVLGIGMLLLSGMGPSTTNGVAARNMVVAGIGLGAMMQMFVLSVQNSVPVRAMGSATALTQFARSIGATLGVTLMGVIVNQRLPQGTQIEGATIHRLPPAGREALANALHPAFLLAAVLCVLVFVISLLWVREVPLRHGFEDVAPVLGDETSPQPAAVRSET
ncbi:MAG: MDR family MFS transporter [Gaiellaceae bacterium]